MKKLILKEFEFLKNIKSEVDLRNAIIDINNEIYFYPVTKSTKTKKGNDLKKYLDSNNTILFVVSDYHKNQILIDIKILKISSSDVIKISCSSSSLSNKIYNNKNLVNFICKIKKLYFTKCIIEKKLIKIKDINFIDFDSKHYEIIDNPISSNDLILTAGPSISQREMIYSSDATINGWNTEWSKYIKKFENEFANYIGVKYAISTSSCTGAMHIALMSLGISNGDEVIVPDITWVSTANAVRLVGAIPIFADVNINTWTLDPISTEKLITKKTKAIMPVHLYGHPCEMDKILKLSKKHDLKIIEDAAPSIGAKFKKDKTGSFGDFSAFSFQGAKLLVTGEGGMLCTNDKKLYEKAYKVWDQGRIPGSFWIEELGLKYKMSNIQASIGLGQLERNDLMVGAKRQINKWYYEDLKNNKKIEFFKESKNSRSIHWMTNIRLKSTKMSREEFCNKLREKGIDSRPVFPSISQYPYWPHKQKQQPNSKLISESGINLPSGVCLTKEKIKYICKSINEILENE